MSGETELESFGWVSQTRLKPSFSMFCRPDLCYEMFTLQYLLADRVSWLSPYRFHVDGDNFRHTSYSVTATSAIYPNWHLPNPSLTLKSAAFNTATLRRSKSETLLSHLPDAFSTLQVNDHSTSAHTPLCSELGITKRLSSSYSLKVYAREESALHSSFSTAAGEAVSAVVVLIRSISFGEGVD